MVRPKRKRPRRVARCPWHHWYKVQWREAATGPVAAWQRRRQRFHDGANKKKREKKPKMKVIWPLTPPTKDPQVWNYHEIVANGGTKEEEEKEQEEQKEEEERKKEKNNTKRRGTKEKTWECEEWGVTWWPLSLLWQSSQNGAIGLVHFPTWDSCLLCALIDISYPLFWLLSYALFDLMESSIGHKIYFLSFIIIVLLFSFFLFYVFLFLFFFFFFSFSMFSSFFSFSFFIRFLFFSFFLFFNIFFYLDKIRIWQ